MVDVEFFGVRLKFLPLTVLFWDIEKLGKVIDRKFVAEAVMLTVTLPPPCQVIARL